MQLKAPGFLHIDLPGGVRVSVDAAVDAGALARVLIDIQARAALFPVIPDWIRDPAT